MQSSSRRARRRGRRTPLGRWIAEALRGTDATRTIANAALGKDVADRLIEVACAAKLEHAARARRDPAIAARAAARRWPSKPARMRGTERRPLLEPRLVPHAERHAIVRRLVALYALIAEQADLDGANVGRAAVGSALSLPTIAARLEVDERTAERMIALLCQARLLLAWQPPAYDAATGVALPRELRGETYAYAMYELPGGVPPCVAGHLRRWEGVTRQADAEASPARALAPHEAPAIDYAAEASTLELGALLAALRARGGPS